ncbi:uncharacterized membrane protein YhaH (DUF805 family) [Acinetobacter calcoaceticus]|uniref:Uncharacterized membrane protein YhaH (DUF805 family) n=1 Tax=Acinetobacter calcoaceticus TaxID=471 RepID=A0A4R1XVZ6_ACICA|nr:uncharacterized membrane protein YhaH (DUF805 family) [Acinetobacter calcoaceticus]
MSNFNPSETSLKDNPFSAKGRFGRLSYLAWIFITSMLYSCFMSLVFIVAIIAFASTGFESDPSIFLSSGMGIFTILLFAILVIVFLVLNINISIRRIHDLNKSGWLCLLFLLPAVNIIFGLYLLFARGTAGSNNFGPERPTEQTERLLGIFYATVMVIMLVAYAVLGAFFYSIQDQLAQLDSIQDTTLMDSDQDASQALDEALTEEEKKIMQEFEAEMQQTQKESQAAN